MNSDDPGEDADILDDDGVIDGCLNVPLAPCADAVGAVMREWPSGASGTSVAVDDVTLAWFRSHHADWPQQMAVVLRGWAMGQIAPTAGVDASEGPCG